MSKSKKKIVVTNAESDLSGARKNISPTISKSSSSTVLHTSDELIFNRNNYVLMAIGAGLILLGLLLMTGGKMPDPNTWDPNIIYSKRITVLAPFTILAGLIVEIFAIFRK